MTDAVIEAAVVSEAALRIERHARVARFSFGHDGLADTGHVLLGGGAVEPDVAHGYVAAREGASAPSPRISSTWHVLPLRVIGSKRQRATAEPSGCSQVDVVEHPPPTGVVPRTILQDA
jgi:hypothetical protein